MSRQKHSEECRKHMEHDMRLDAWLQRRKASGDGFLEDVLRREDDKAAKRAGQEASASGASGATAVERKRAQADFDQRASTPRKWKTS